MNREYRAALEKNDIVGAFKAVQKEVRAGIDKSGASSTKHYVKKNKGQWTSYRPGGQRISIYGSNAAAKARADHEVAYWNRQMKKSVKPVKKTTKRRA